MGHDGVITDEVWRRTARSVPRSRLIVRFSPHELVHCLQAARGSFNHADTQSQHSQSAQFAVQLRVAVASGASAEQLQAQRTQMLSCVHRILLANFGAPPQTFDWRYCTGL